MPEKHSGKDALRAAPMTRVADMANLQPPMDIAKALQERRQRVSDLIFSSKTDTITKLLKSVQDNMKMVNDLKRENTGIVEGIGDALSIGIRHLWGAGYETGKEQYEQSMEQCHKQATRLQDQLARALDGTLELTSEQLLKLQTLMNEIEKVSGVKLENVSWAKATFNTIGLSNVNGDARTLANRAKIFAKTTISVVEGWVDATAFVLETAGKLSWTLAAYSLEPEVRAIIENDVMQILSQLTWDNGKKALALLPEAMDTFANASPDEQAEGFGKFFGNILVAWGIGVKVFQWAKHAVRLGYRATRMSMHTWGPSFWLAAAGALHMSAGSAGLAAGGSLRMAEMNILPGKKWVKKALQIAEVADRKVINNAGKVRADKVRDLPKSVALNKEIATEAIVRGVKEDIVRIEKLIQDGLSSEQAGRVIQAHNIAKEGEKLWGYGQESLAAKIRTMTQEGEGQMTQEQARAMLIKGYAGEIQMTTQRVKQSQIDLAEIRSLTGRGSYEELKFLLRNPEVTSQISHESISAIIQRAPNPKSALMSIIQDPMIRSDLRMTVAHDMSNRLSKAEFITLKSNMVSVVEKNNGVVVASREMNGGTRSLVRFAGGSTKSSEGYASWYPELKKVNGMETQVYTFNPITTRRSGELVPEYYRSTGERIRNESLF